jgi:UDP-N-acetylmuramoyl-L-alanyl-D-glutamate--2,6-diaminopimelate ligase
MFTNFTQDHLDYHGDMAGYWQAKLALFNWVGLQAAVVNVDDTHGAALATQLQARGDLHVWTLSCALGPYLEVGHDMVISEQAAEQHIVARSIQQSAMGLSFEVVDSKEVHAIDTQLVGHYNVSNVLGVIACLRALGHSLVDAVQACRVLPAVPGRMQTVGKAGEPLVVIDYAHTPDALQKTLDALRPLYGAGLTRVVQLAVAGVNADPFGQSDLIDSPPLTVASESESVPGAVPAFLGALPVLAPPALVLAALAPAEPA